VHDWRITFVDTGLNTNIGQRLLRVRRHLAGEKAFLANYSDGLSNVPLDRQIADFERRA
jgi:glucose-1-phosphate cytidylyltransferase